MATAAAASATAAISDRETVAFIAPVRVEPPADTAMGFSRGTWEGDSLLVSTKQLQGNWLDRAGNFYSETAHMVERFTPITADAIRYEVTIDDPNVFTQPWTISMPLYRRLESNAQLLEYPCVEFVEEFMYGDARKTQLVKHWEGDSIIVDITRRMRARPVGGAR